jgi:hypothetical protein
MCICDEAVSIPQWQSDTIQSKCCSTWPETKGQTLCIFRIPLNSKPFVNRSVGVFGLPRAFLIDATGRIAWAGHPAGFDVEREIDSLLGP